MSVGAQLGLGSRQWRDFFSNTTGWTHVSLAPSRSRRSFDAVAKPSGPTIVHLAPGEYTGPLHISAPYPVLLRPSQLGEAAKVIIRCPEPDRTSRRVRYTTAGGNNNNSNFLAAADSTAAAGEELPMDPAMILSHNAQVFVEGIHFHGRVEVLDGASAEFLDCTVKLAPHVASATAQIAGARDAPPAPIATTGKGGHATYRTTAATTSSQSHHHQRDIIVGVGAAYKSTDVLCRELSAVSVLSANMWASNCVFDVLAPNGVGLFASGYVNPAGVAVGDYEAEQEYQTQQTQRLNANKPAQTSGNINITACVLRRATYGLVFYGDSSFAPRVENNKVSGCSAAGIVCAGASRGSFRGNHVGHCDRFGIVLEGSCAPWLHMNIIEENGICGVVARDKASPTLVRNTLLANGTVQLFCADVATVRAQNSHFSGESVNGAAPSAAGLSSFAARSILEAPKGDVYAVCATDNSNLLLDNCVIECADSCVISATGATIKCSNCTLQPEAADRKAAADAVAENDANNNNSSSSYEKEEKSAADNNSNNNNDALFAENNNKEDQQGKAAAAKKISITSYPGHRTFVKSDFATLTTDGSVVSGASRIEVRALEDFPDVEAVICEIPNHLFESIASAAAAAVAASKARGGDDDYADDGGEQPSSPSRHRNNSSDHHINTASSSRRQHTPPPPPGVMRSDAAIRMSLSFTPRRPLSASTAGSFNHNNNKNSNGGSLSCSTGLYRHVAAPPHRDRPASATSARRSGGDGGGSLAGVGPGATTSSAQRLHRFDPPQQKTDWHELKDKKQIYALKVEVSRLRKQLYSGNNNQQQQQQQQLNSSSSVAAQPNRSSSTPRGQDHNNNNNNNSNNAQSGSNTPKFSPRIIGGGDMDDSNTHRLGYHRWNNSKMKDFYHGKATLAEVRCEEKNIPGTDASLGERLHDRWLRHRIDERQHSAEQEEQRAQEEKRHALSKDAQKDLGRRLHDDVMERFRQDRARILKEEKERLRVHAPYMAKNAERRSKTDPSHSSSSSGANADLQRSTVEEEELRCQRIAERLREQAEARKLLHKRLLQQYHIEPLEKKKKKKNKDGEEEDDDEEGGEKKRLTRKQIEAYCASLHKSHRDEQLAAAALDSVSFEFAQKSKARDEALRTELLGRSGSSPKRTREQVEAYSESLYKGHKDIGAHNRAKDLLADT